MLAEIEKFLSNLLISLQLAKVYPIKHPIVVDALDKLFKELSGLLVERHNLVVGIIGGELAFENEVFFDLSKNVKQAVNYMKDRGIERITFCRGIAKEELDTFFELLLSKQEPGHSAQEFLAVKGVKNIVLDKISVDSPDINENQRAFINYLNRYNDSLDKVSELMKTVMDGEIMDYLGTRFTVVNVLDNLINAQQEFLKLTNLKKLDVSTFIHILNVCILSMFLSYKLGFCREDVLDIGMAGLFHDIGKLYISRKIITKSDKLTDEEFSTIKSHTVLGSRLLLKYVETMGYLPAVVAFEHHLKYNMKGYPKLSFTYKPHIASMIVSVCDVYDALNLRRSYKRDYPPDMVYNIMIKERGTSFEPQALDKFFTIIGVWPAGTVVWLSDSRIAIVREEHEDDIFSPRVEVIVPEEKRELIDLRTTKPGLKIEKAMNPLAEGKPYLSFI